MVKMYDEYFRLLAQRSLENQHRMASQLEAEQRRRLLLHWMHR